jgi:transposase
MICPVLELFQDWEGLDASNGAVTGALSQSEAAEILGMSERTFRRYRDRFEAEGADGLYDWRLGRASARRAGADEVMKVLALFDTRYFDFTAKHFWDKLVAEHGVSRSYNWVEAWGAPAQAAATADGGHAAAPGRLEPRVGAGCGVGSDRHDGRRYQRDLLGFLCA